MLGGPAQAAGVAMPCDYHTHEEGIPNRYVLSTLLSVPIIYAMKLPIHIMDLLLFRNNLSWYAAADDSEWNSAELRARQQMGTAQ